MAMSNAERQARYKARRKSEGLMQVTEWIVKGGGLARSENGAWPLMTKRQLDGAIKKAVAVFDHDEMYKEAVYAEIAAYAEKAAARFAAYRSQEQGSQDEKLF
jgi:hypothetical protein